MKPHCPSARFWRVVTLLFGRGPLYFVLLFLHSHVIHDEDKPWIGQTVITKRDGLMLRQGDRVVGTYDAVEGKVLDEDKDRIKLSSFCGVEGWLNKADVLLSGDAVSYFGNLLQGPNAAEAYRRRGHARVVLADFDGALLDLSEAIRLSPQSAANWYGRARALDIKGDFDKALEDYDETIQLDPRHAAALVYRGGIWINRKDYQKGGGRL